MARRPPSFTQADVTRLIKGAVAAGIAVEKIAGVEKTKGGVAIVFGDREATATGGILNPWDEVLR